jgi:hypothetical protein
MAADVAPPGLPEGKAESLSGGLHLRFYQVLRVVERVGSVAVLVGEADSCVGNSKRGRGVARILGTEELA